MGVQELWSILEPVRKSVPLFSLSGKTLAVDLSLWVCEAQHVQAMMGRVTKPYLRNLFFRVSSLTLMGVKLIFVMEGEAPKLKAETMNKRNQSRFRGSQKAAAAPKSTTNTNRGRFKAILKECAEMLDYMGVPWVTAAGEAEAMCAYLDSQGLVDGCITNDGDAFLYGAKTIYRNFNMNTKDPQVDCYQTSDVQRELRLSRENLVGLAIFLGCDYIPKGIQGVGKEQALRLIRTLEGQTILQKFGQWKEDNTFIPESTVKKVPHCNICQHPGSVKAHEKGGCLLCDSKRFCEPQDFDYQCPCDWHHKEQSRQAVSLETNVRKKTIANPLFPFTEIINEFLISKDKPISHFKRRQPNMLLIQKFAYDKMEWPKHYTSEKILVLMTYTNLINKKYGRDGYMQVKPLRILKPRVRNGVCCFEVVWTTPEHYSFPEDPVPENQEEVRTIEEESLFRVAYPEMVERFQKEKALAEENKTKKKKAKSTKEKIVDGSDGISDLLAKITLQSSSSNVKVQPKILPSISSPFEPNMPMSTTVVSHERHDKSGSLCPGDVSYSMPPPGSEEVASLSVSAVINALHLSDIDWESASFTSSPLPPTNPSITVQPKLVQILHNDKENNERSQKTTIFEATDSISLDEQFSKEQTLQKQVFMKNEDCQISRNGIISKPGSKKLFSPEQSSSQNKTSNDQKYTKSKLSEKANPVQQKLKNLSVTNAAKSSLHVSKLSVKASALSSLATQSNNSCNPHSKPPQKFKFVKTSLVPQRFYSDPGECDKVKIMSTKKSVCVSVCLSSDDSDGENQVTRERKSKAKIKTKHSDNSLRPVPKVVELNVPETNSSSRSHSLQVGTISLLPGNEWKDNSPGVKHKVFLPCPASPAIDLSDDSVICSDSPLPLAERLKLKFQK